MVSGKANNPARRARAAGKGGKKKNEVVSFLSALANPTRLAALDLVYASKDELCLCEIMSRLDISQSSASRHMSSLVVMGLVLDRRDLQWVRYRRNKDLSPETKKMIQIVLDASRNGRF